jgi:hypothetical protein
MDWWIKCSNPFVLQGDNLETLLELNDRVTTTLTRAEGQKQKERNERDGEWSRVNSHNNLAVHPFAHSLSGLVEEDEDDSPLSLSGSSSPRRRRMPIRTPASPMSASSQPLTLSSPATTVATAATVTPTTTLSVKTTFTTTTTKSTTIPVQDRFSAIMSAVYAVRRGENQQETLCALQSLAVLAGLTVDGGVAKPISNSNNIDNGNIVDHDNTNAWSSNANCNINDSSNTNGNANANVTDEVVSTSAQMPPPPSLSRQQEEQQRELVQAALREMSVAGALPALLGARQRTEQWPDAELRLCRLVALIARFETDLALLQRSASGLLEALFILQVKTQHNEREQGRDEVCQFVLLLNNAFVFVC